MVERNDPCPCGSGKKYKKCCLAKDQAAHAQRLEATGSSGLPKLGGSLEFPDPEPVFDASNVGDITPLPEVDPLMERMDAFWGDFIDAPYETQWAMVTEMLAEEPELCDGEMVFEITNALFEKALDPGELGRYNQLLDQLEETVPEAYQEELHFILERRIQIALIEGDDASVAHYFYQFSSRAGDNLDLYYHTVSALEYHGKEEILYEGMRQARPYVADGEGLVEWAYGEFVEKLGAMEVVHLLAGNPNLRPDNPTLLQYLEEYGLAFEPATLSAVLDYRTGRQTPDWTADDFEFRKGDENDPAKNRLIYLLAAFTRFAYLEEEISPIKAEMVIDELNSYLIMRSSGELGKPGRSRKKRQSRSRKQNSGKYAFQHPLCPDAKSLDRYLGDLLGFLSFRHYEAFALFELIPAWLRFLTKYDLIDKETRLMVLKELNYLKGQLMQIARNNESDPALLENIGNWPYESEGVDSSGW